MEKEAKPTNVNVCVCVTVCDMTKFEFIEAQTYVTIL